MCKKCSKNQSHTFHKPQEIPIVEDRIFYKPQLIKPTYIFRLPYRAKMFCVCAMCPAINKYKTPGHACSCTLTTRLGSEPHHNGIWWFGHKKRQARWVAVRRLQIKRPQVQAQKGRGAQHLSISLSVLFGACAAYTRVSAGDTCDAHATLYKATANTYASINWSVHLHINTHAQSV